MVARTWRYPRFTLTADRQQWALDGMVDLVLTSAAYPTAGDLMRTGTQAISRAVYQINQMHGRPDVHGTRQTHKNYVIYWLSLPRLDIPVDAIVERIAVRQAMQTLTVKQRAALEALALHDNNPRRAAAYLGLPQQTFSSRVIRARKVFAEAWFWPDTPAELWKTEQKVIDTEERRQIRRETMRRSLCIRRHGTDCGCHYRDRLGEN
jgi:hypothetical protein